MPPEIPLDPLAQRLEIASGATRTLVLRAGATLVCVAGSVQVQEAAAGAQAAGSLHLPVSARVNAGEAHWVQATGILRVTALRAADVICVDVPGPISRFLGAMAKIFQVKRPEMGKKGLGALHKIS